MSECVCVSVCMFVCVGWRGKVAREGESEVFVSVKILRRKRKADLPEQDSSDFAAEWSVVPLVQHISNRIVYDCCSLQITYQWVKST